MIIVEIAQGRYADLTGVSRTDALASFAEHDAAFLAAHPKAAPYHRPTWLEREVRDDQTAPFGYEWYRVDCAGLLQRHSAQYDSSG